MLPSLMLVRRKIEDVLAASIELLDQTMRRSRCGGLCRLKLLNITSSLKLPILAVSCLLIPAHRSLSPMKLTL